MPLDDAFTASKFENFAPDLLSKDPAVVKVFDFNGDTNGGADSTRILENAGINELNGGGFSTIDSYRFEWSGADAAGKQSTSDFDTYLEALGGLFGGTQLADADILGFCD